MKDPTLHLVKKQFSRRKFVAAAGLGALASGSLRALAQTSPALKPASDGPKTLAAEALYGGKPAD
jgi:hypothetical protein